MLRLLPRQSAVRKSAAARGRSNARIASQPGRLRYCAGRVVLWLATFTLAGLALSCSHTSSPEDLANEFLFRYFIELNQRGALELSSGLARDKLEEEIELTQSIRMTPDLDLAKHKPFLDYKLVNTQRRGEDGMTLFYDISIESPGGSPSKREVVLTTSRIDGAWKVTNFDTFLKR